MRERMSTPPFEELTNLDRLVHEPARLAILTALASCDAAEFLFLQSLTGLTKGNLNVHLGKLEQAGLVAIEKGFRGKVPRTSARLTDAGRQTIDVYWERMQAMRKAADQWRESNERSVSEEE
jgi:DNA-binding transcriptional ArsR family regulator